MGQTLGIQEPLGNSTSKYHRGRADPEVAKGLWKGIRAPGTHVPGVIIAGTYYKKGQRIFWDVKDPKKAIVIDLADERYNQLIVEVEDPSRSVQEIQGMI